MYGAVTIVEKPLNPLAVEGQIIGSCHMGLGQVLTEQMVYGRTGHLQNPNLLDYKIPSVHEMPNVTQPIIESCDPEGPFGAKEAGILYTYPPSSSKCSIRCYWH